MSNFQDVVDFNRLFGVFVADEFKPEVLENESLVNLRFGLIDEEVKELEQATRDRDLVEVVDALADILYVVYGAGASFGIKLTPLYPEYSGTNFEQTKQWYRKNVQFGFPVRDSLNREVFETEVWTRCLADLRTLTDGLRKALDQRNGDHVEQSLHGLAVMAYLAGAVAGFDLDRAFAIVHASNMSKACPTEEKARETVDWYRANETRYDSPAYRESFGKWVVFNKSTGKVLKSVDYTPAELKPLVEES